MEKTKFDLLFEDIVTNYNMMDGDEEINPNICVVCKAEFGDGDAKFEFDAGITELEDLSPLCYNCAQKIALNKKDIINRGDAELRETDNRFELWTTCDSCEGLNPESEIKVTDAGNLCEYCIEGDISRGEKIRISYNESPIG